MPPTPRPRPWRGSRRASTPDLAIERPGGALSSDDAVRRDDPRPRRPDAARPAHPGHPRPGASRTAAARPRQARDAQPGRLGQGPDRAADDRGRRASRAPEAGRDDHRADVGQHRPRPRDRRRAQGLPLHLRHGRQAVDREAGAPAGVRRGGRPVPDERRPESPESYYSVAARLARDIPGAFKPDQYWNMENPTRPRAFDRAGGLGPDRGPGHPLRGERRDGRDDLRRRPLPARAEPRRRDRRRRSGGLRPVGRRRPAVSHRGRRRGLLPGHLRPGSRRPLGAGQRPRRVRGGAPPDARGGDPRRRLVRHGARRRAGGRARAGRRR